MNIVYLSIGASFAEALGMCTMTQVSKKRNNNSPNTSASKVMKAEQSAAINNKKVTVKIEPTNNNLRVIYIINYFIYIINYLKNFLSLKNNY